MGRVHGIDGPPSYLTAVFNGGGAGDDGWPSRAEPSERSLIVPHWLYIRCALFLDTSSRAASERRGYLSSAAVF